jgi:thiamine-phosphate pyrophosphorylase
VNTFDLALYLVTDPGLCAARGLIETITAAVKGGVTLVQLRDKTATDAELIARGQAAKAALRHSGARLIINDRLSVAEAIGADGLHLGQCDGDPGAARARLGRNAIIGVSVETPERARAVDAGVVDYLGVGPVFATPTKADHARPLGFAGLKRICAVMPGVPKVAIGGLGAEHAASVIEAGAEGLAVVSAICAAADPQVAARGILDEVQRARARRQGR